MEPLEIIRWEDEFKAGLRRYGSTRVYTVVYTPGGPARFEVTVMMERRDFRPYVESEFNKIKSRLPSGNTAVLYCGLNN